MNDVLKKLDKTIDFKAVRERVRTRNIYDCGDDRRDLLKLVDRMRYFLDHQKDACSEPWENDCPCGLTALLAELGNDSV